MDETKKLPEKNHEEPQVEIVELEGKQYKRIFTKDGEYWDLKTIAEHTEVPYRTIAYHLKNKKQLFDPLIKQVQIVAFSDKPITFLKIPEGINNLRRCVRALRFHPVMDRILELASEVQKGAIKIAKTEDIEELKGYVTKLETELKELKQTPPFIEEQKAFFKTLITEMKSDRKEMWKEFREDRQHITILDSNVNIVQEKVDVLEEEVEDLKLGSPMSSQHIKLITDIKHDVAKHISKEESISLRPTAHTLVTKKLKDDKIISTYRNAEVKFFPEVIDWFYKHYPKITRTVCINHVMSGNIKYKDILKTLRSLGILKREGLDYFV